jgi:hypothetical protein
MIHIQNASLTGGAVVASTSYLIAVPFRFKTMTKEAISSLSVLALLCEKSPVNGNSSWISYNGFNLAPKEEKEKNMKYSQ